ncbi:hypothetical protein JW823_06510 [bacterium]|nr:hypothetical protein [candidate division CSSED10-310 bacterium]
MKTLSAIERHPKRSKKIPPEVTWHVVQTKAHGEQLVAERLKLLEIVSYVPLVKNKIFIFGTLKHRVQALFPQYIFVQAGFEDSFTLIQRTIGVKRLVCFNGTPAIVRDDVIRYLKRQENGSGIISLPRSFEPNQKVMVRYGLMKDLQGLFIKELSGPDRVLVLMQIMGISTQVQMDSSMLAVV